MGLVEKLHLSLTQIRQHIVSNASVVLILHLSKIIIPSRNDKKLDLSVHYTRSLARSYFRFYSIQHLMKFDVNITAYLESNCPSFCQSSKFKYSRFKLKTAKYDWTLMGLVSWDQNVGARSYNSAIPQLASELATSRRTKKKDDCFYL